MKFWLYAKKSFKEFAGDFELFAICFLPKFDEIDNREPFEVMGEVRES
jgi:hypothetical protein